MLRFLLCSFALVLLYPTGIDLYLVGLPQIAQDLQASEPQLHIAFSVYLAGMAATMLIAGGLADRYGRKPLTLFGSLVFMLASLAGGMATSSEVFLLTRFIQGIGAGSCYVVAFAILRDTLDDRRRAKVLSVINGVTCIIPVLAPVVGYLIMLKFPWHSLFFTMAAMGLLVFLLCTLVLTESLPKRAVTPPDAPRQRQAVDESFKQRFFISRLIITTLGITTILTYVNASPFLVMEQLEFSRGQYSLVMALTALVSMISAFSTPYWLSRFKEKNLMLTAQVLFVSAAVVLLAAQKALLPMRAELLGFVLICTAFSLGFGVTMSQALSPFRLRAGMASSLLGITQVCTSALYIWLMGALGVEALNMLLVILIAGGAFSAALILWVPTSPQAKPHEEVSGAT